MGKVRKGIAVLVRTRNEERNIGRFIDSYWWADRIFIADGGSEDYTFDIINLRKDFISDGIGYPKIAVRRFIERTELANGLWRNPAGEHINFLIDWAEKYSPEWLIFDDCDCVPNKELRYWGYEWLNLKAGRERLEKYDSIYVPRLYVYGKDMYFKNMTYFDDKWQGGLWAWRASLKLRFKTNPSNHTHELEEELPEKSKLRFIPPMCLLHYFFPSEEEYLKKQRFYVKSGQHPSLVHPRETYGEPEYLPKEYDYFTLVGKEDDYEN